MMRVFLTLVRREVGAHFVSWTGYVVVAAMLFLLGLSFIGILHALNAEPLTQPLTEIFNDSFAFWVIVLIGVPLITMRSFAQEKHSGTFETLMTTPVSDVVVVAGKYAGALLMYCLMWVPLAPLLLVLRHYVTAPGALDYGVLGTTALGMFLLGGLYVAMGCLASSLTRSQVIAAIVTFAAGVAMFLLGFLAQATPPQLGFPALILHHVNMLAHMRDFSRGLLDTRALVFYTTATFLLLYLNLKAVESRRWK